MKKQILTLAMILSVTFSFAQWTQYAPNPVNEPANAASQILNPTNHALLLIDHEGQMAFAVESQPIEELRNNTGILAGTSKLFEIPTIVTTVAEKQFSGQYSLKSESITRMILNILIELP